ncbi:F-box/kelch-repeat protein SKIP25 [Tanacetum coccineum]
MANPTSSRATTKRRKLSDDKQSLLPGLPDHIAHLCLSLVSPSTLFSVCRAWRRYIYTAACPPFRSLYTLSLPTAGGAAASSHHNQTLKLHSYDPISSKWTTIDSPPHLKCLTRRQPSFISRNLPIQSLSFSGQLVLIAATTIRNNQPSPAFTHPILFDPLSNSWSLASPLTTPRRWCAAGAFQETLIIASGVGTHYTQSVSHTCEKWVLLKNDTNDHKRKISHGFFEKMRNLKNSKLCREAIDAVGLRGKLCMVNVKGDYAKEGFVYEIENDEWVDMPAGMLAGWKGPAAAMDEKVIFVVDEKKGVLRRYDEDKDCWVDVVVDERLKEAEYIAAGGGRVKMTSATKEETFRDRRTFYRSTPLTSVIPKTPEALRIYDRNEGVEATGEHTLQQKFNAWSEAEECFAAHSCGCRFHRWSLYEERNGVADAFVGMISDGFPSGIVAGEDTATVAQFLTKKFVGPTFDGLVTGNVLPSSLPHQLFPSDISLGICFPSDMSLAKGSECCWGKHRML